jgi:hypothetical protein
VHVSVRAAGARQAAKVVNISHYHADDAADLAARAQGEVLLPIMQLVRWAVA